MITKKEITYSFGNTVDYKCDRSVNFIVWCWFGEEGTDGFAAKILLTNGDGFCQKLNFKNKKSLIKELPITGITPTCLAEMAREKNEDITMEYGIFNDKKAGWTISGLKRRGQKDFCFAQEKNESLESFCLRVAVERKYFKPENAN